MECHKHNVQSTLAIKWHSHSSTAAQRNNSALAAEHVVVVVVVVVVAAAAAATGTLAVDTLVVVDTFAVVGTPVAVGNTAVDTLAVQQRIDDRTEADPHTHPWLAAPRRALGHTHLDYRTAVVRNQALQRRHHRAPRRVSRKATTPQCRFVPEFPRL